MDGFARFLIHTIATISFFAHNGTLPPSPVVKKIITPATIQEKMIYASTDINQYGKTVHFSAYFPEKGGAVKGVISGDCDGIISGVYSGEAAGKRLNGSAKASCPVALFSVDIMMSFQGLVNSDNTKATFNYTASAAGNTKTGTTNLSLTTK